ncbi:MAG: lytic murein transglycosylase, partial [Paracoccaceae bacterium]|nr:lytic murein transglycosylase [Paracoccaceae bacterium]
MVVSRRVALLGVAAFGLSGCGRRASVAASPRVPDDLQPVRNANYDAWVRGFRARAANQGISQSTLDAGFRGAGYLPGVVKRDRNQTEFNRTLEDYLAIAASDERVT